jgi:hypothetical protein
MTALVAHRSAGCAALPGCHRARAATAAPATNQVEAAFKGSPVPPGTCDNFSPHLTTVKDGPVGAWAAANNVEIAYAPTNSSWLNRIEAQFSALRYFALDGTDHASQQEQASMIRRYLIWRNNHAYDERLRQVVYRAT